MGFGPSPLLNPYLDLFSFIADKTEINEFLKA